MVHKSHSTISEDHNFNQQVAARLREIAQLLEQQQANVFRVRAYQNAAASVERLQTDIKGIVAREGIQGLVALPAIGAGIARSIYEFVATGHMSRLDNLKGESDPVRLFQSIPGVGKKLANRMYAFTHADSFEALEMAINNGTLRRLPGLGSRRIDSIHSWLLHSLGAHKMQPREQATSSPQPSVELLLQVDAEYRDKAAAGTLPTIAPKRFNPEAKAWLAILHRHYQNWHFTALYSNTPLAHQLRRTNDWVVIYFYDEDHQEGQYTVVTETRGSLIGKRVVRGRERECRDYYDLKADSGVD